MVMGAVRASLANAREYGANPVAFYRRLTGTGESFRPVVPFEMFGPNVLVNDPDLVATVLTSPSAQSFEKNGLRFFTVLRRMLGSGLFSIDGDQHTRERRMMQPTLRAAALRPAAAAMTRAAERLRTDLAVEPSRMVEVQEAAERTALDLLAEAVAGPHLAEQVRELGHLFTKAEPVLLRVLQAPVVFPEWLPTPNNRRLAHATAAFRDRAADLLLERPPGPETLLGQLLARGSSGKQLLDQLVTLVVGGHQSTAAAITFTLYLLAKHPSEAREVTDEATSVLNGRAATIDDLPALPRTAMVVAESLRLFPPVWIIMRRTVGVQHLGSGALPSGTVVHISPHTLHRHPTHWPEPERFLPDRFADTRGQHRFAYAPFGAGPHKCVGNHFALMATAIVVATVIPAVQFSPPVPEVSVATRSFTIPDGGLRLRIGHRSR